MTDHGEHRKHRAALDTLARDPYPLYARARDTPGLTFVPEWDAWLVSRYKDVREVLRSPEDFSSARALRPPARPAPEALAVLAEGPGGGPVVLSSDGETHQELRAPVVRGLSAPRVAAVREFVTARAGSLIDAFTARGGAELMEAYARPLPAEVICRLYGLDEAETEVALRGSRQAEALLFRTLPVDAQVRAARDVVALQRLLAGHVVRRRERPGDDLISELTRALAPPDAGALSDELLARVVSNLQNLLAAGHLTTTALIGTVVHRLLAERSLWERLCAHPESIPEAVEEAARWGSPVQGFFRLTTRPVTLSGTELPPGASLFVSYAAANRDPSLTADPDTYAPSRPRTHHLAFGHGPHACPGSSLARAQLHTTLDLLTRRLPSLRLAAGGPVEMSPTLIHWSPKSLSVAWD
ncbi:cytochrome P450 [Streptomyces luteolus]|uniref:Cytochrome P450 n=1 Tax=Streptomyces luteolus TaxID=3043615 RepID=A0ABT6T0Q1_9ACTN|nr:cytochrome P450 [Streptomyces sp. B-S-A12]MDI3421442.1 cytochrome P450 [Streptomyces sp. B-S-A12]